MSSITVLELPDEERRLYALTLHQYQQMIDDAILPEGEPFELIHGQVMLKDRSAAGEDPMTVGNRHSWCVKRIAKLAPRFDGAGCHLQTQQPIALPPNNEPEPDASIIVGTEDDYLRRKPGPGDVLCAIEVADSSLAFDRTVKLAIYAAAGIPLYVFVNLREQTVEVYRSPDPSRSTFLDSQILGTKDVIRLPTGSDVGIDIPLQQLLP